jgi:hypothetical protein
MSDENVLSGADMGTSGKGDGFYFGIPGVPGVSRRSHRSFHDSFPPSGAVMGDATDSVDASSAGSLMLGTTYMILVDLELPRSLRNQAAAKFMIHMTTFDSTGEPTATSRRPVVLPYEHWLLSLSKAALSTFVRMLLRKGDTVTVSTTLVNAFHETVPATREVELVLSTASADVEAAYLSIIPEVRGVQWLLFHYPALSLVCLCGVLSGLMVGLVLVVSGAQLIAALLTGDLDLVSATSTSQPAHQQQQQQQQSGHSPNLSTTFEHARRVTPSHVHPASFAGEDRMSAREHFGEVDSHSPQTPLSAGRFLSSRGLLGGSGGRPSGLRVESTGVVEGEVRALTVDGNGGNENTETRGKKEEREEDDDDDDGDDDEEDAENKMSGKWEDEEDDRDWDDSDSQAISRLLARPREVEPVEEQVMRRRLAHGGASPRNSPATGTA